ncbi:MAG: hypothetical protein K2M56_01015 [Muribaculaceae bacterium]|nr:hypothetical protein [Muribaculaceae bacterium]
MAQITILKDKEGKSLYPATSGKAVFDSEGVDLETRLNNHSQTLEDCVRKDDVANMVTADSAQNIAGIKTFENGFLLPFNSQKMNTERAIPFSVSGNYMRIAFVDTGLTYNPVTRRLYAEGGFRTKNGSKEELLAADGSVISQDLVARLTLRDRWLSRLARYPGLPTYEEDVENTLADGSQFGLYGETFEYEDALAILENSVMFTSSLVALYYQKSPKGSALFPILTATDSLANTFCQCQQRILGLYDPRLNTLSVSPSNMSGLFNSCAKLERIVATISMRNCTNVTTAFWNCHALREVRLHGLKMSISFQWSSKLSLESLTYMVGNSANTAAITITVHSAVYAKITGADSADYGDDDPQDWSALLELALERNISFAVA